jgi:hypothetical protein
MGSRLLGLLSKIRWRRDMVVESGVTRKVLESWLEVGSEGAAFCVSIMYYSTCVKSVSSDHLSDHHPVYA